MKKQRTHPRWWQVYVMLPFLVGLFWPEMEARLSEAGHVILELGIVLLIFAFIQVWLRANRSALLQLEEPEDLWQSHIHVFPAAQLRPHENMEEDAGSHTPAPEIKGVLSNTFEWAAAEDEASVFGDRTAALRKEHE
jgi:hypothetical protein